MLELYLAVLDELYAENLLPDGSEVTYMRDLDDNERTLIHYYDSSEKKSGMTIVSSDKLNLI